MREMKDSKIGWIGDIPVTWNIIRAKNIFKNHKDIVGSKEDEYERLALTLNGVLKRAKDDSKGLQSESLSTYQILNKNELVFKMIDLANVNTSRVGYSPFTGIVSPVYIIFNNEKYSKFGYYFFYSMWQREIFNKLGNDGVRSALNASDMLNLPFPDISEKEAKIISDFLDEKVLEIDHIIEKTKETIEDYKKYKQSIITEAVTKGLNKNVDIKACNNKWIKNIPITWNIQKLKTFIKIPVVDGPHESPELFDEGIPYISATAIVNGKINFELMRGYISEEYCNQCDLRYKPQINDILVIKLGATTGQVAIVDMDKRFNIWVPLAAVRCNSSVNSKFIYYSFQSISTIRQMELMWTFGTQQTLGVKTIEQLIFVIPSKYEQDEIVKYLDKKCMEIDKLISSKEKIIEELDKYKKSLIYEYVTGKKEVI